MLIFMLFLSKPFFKKPAAEWNEENGKASSEAEVKYLGKPRTSFDQKCKLNCQKTQQKLYWLNVWIYKSYPFPADDPVHQPQRHLRAVFQEGWRLPAPQRRGHLRQVHQHVSLVRFPFMKKKSVEELRHRENVWPQSNVGSSPRCHFIQNSIQHFFFSSRFCKFSIQYIECCCWY